MNRHLSLLTLVVGVALVCAAAAEEKAGVAADKERPRTTRETDKDGKVTERIYDEYGNVIIKKLNAGTKEEQRWLYTYSLTGQLLREDAPDGTRILYEYETPESKKPSRTKTIGPDGKEVQQAEISPCSPRLQVAGPC